MAKSIKALRYSDLFKVVWLALVIAWVAVAKTATDRVLLPVVCAEAGPAAGRLRVTKNDGTLSNGAKLRGWRYTAYFGALGGLCLVGSPALFFALMLVWPGKGSLNRDVSRDALKKPAPIDDLLA